MSFREVRITLSLAVRVYAENFKLSKGTYGDIGKMADRINELVRVAHSLNERVTEIELKYIGK